MDDYETTGDLNDAIYYERLDADMEMAELERQGMAYWRREQKARKFIELGKLDDATVICPHGHVGGLTGSCTDRDPRHGEEGYRCFTCGGHVTGIGGDVLNIR